MDVLSSTQDKGHLWGNDCVHESQSTGCRTLNKEHAYSKLEPTEHQILLKRIQLPSKLYYGTKNTFLGTNGTGLILPPSNYMHVRQFLLTGLF